MGKNGGVFKAFHKLIKDVFKIKEDIVMEIIFSSRFERQCEIGEVSHKDILLLANLLTGCFSHQMAKYDRCFVESYQRRDYEPFPLMTRVKIWINAFGPNVGEFANDFTIVIHRSKDKGCMQATIEKGCTL